MATSRITLYFFLENQLLYKVETDHAQLVPFSAGGAVNYSVLKKFLGHKFNLPSDAIAIHDTFNYRPDLYHFIEYTPNDGNVVNQSGTYYWTYASEEPENWRSKRDRLVKILETALDQITSDMNVSLFGIYRKYVVKEDAFDEKLWQDINKLEGKSILSLTHNEADIDVIYNDHFSILNRIEERTRIKVNNILKDMGICASNIQSLLGNIQKMDQNDLAGPISECDLNISQIGSGVNVGLSHVINYIKGEGKVETISSVSLDFALTSTLSEIQKVSGIFSALKAEKCELIKCVHQLQTRKYLWITREYLRFVLLSIPDFSHAILPKYHEASVNVSLKRRRTTYVTQGCVPVCCTDLGSSFAIPPLSQGETPIPQAETTFAQEIASRLERILSDKPAELIHTITKDFLLVSPFSKGVIPREQFEWTVTHDDKIIIGYLSIGPEPGIYLVKGHLMRRHSQALPDEHSFTVDKKSDTLQLKKAFETASKFLVEAWGLDKVVQARLDSYVSIQTGGIVTSPPPSPLITKQQPVTPQNTTGPAKATTTTSAKKTSPSPKKKDS